MFTSLLSTTTKIVLIGILSNVVSGLYSASDEVVLADINSFNKIVMKTYHPVMVEFFAPWCGHCKNLAPQYKRAAKNLKGASKLVAVDCDEDKNKPLCAQYEIKGFPTLKYFPAGKVKGMPQDYHGPREAPAIQKHMMGLLSSRNIYTVGGTSKKSLPLAEFKSRKEGKYPRVLLVNDKKAAPAYYKALSAEFYGRAIFGEVAHDQKDVVDALTGVEKTPALIVFPASADGNTDEAGVVYSGDFKLKPVTQFLKGFVSGKDESDKSERTQKPAPPPEPFDPEIKEITSQEEFDKICNQDQKNACIVSFFFVEAEFKESVDAFNASIELLKKVKKEFYDKKTPFPFVYVDTAKVGSFLVQELGVSDMFPSLTAIHVKRNAYQNHLGAFDEASISSFLNDLRLGKGKTFELKGKPLLQRPSGKSPHDL